MKKYQFCQEQKIAIWQRHYFTVKAASQKKAEEIIVVEDLSADFVGDLADGKTVVFDRSEYLYDTGTDMDPKDNGGYATTMIFDMNRKSICKNGLDPLLDKPKRKELRVFAWYYSLLSRDASDDEIVKAWENGISPDPEDDDDNEQYEVEIYTPDEFAERINDDECPFGQYYVRFIEIAL